MNKLETPAKDSSNIPMSSKYQKREEIQFPFHKFHFYISASCEHHLQTGIGTEGTFCNCSLF